MYIYTHVYTCVCMCVCMYIYIYIYTYIYTRLKTLERQRTILLRHVLLRNRRRYERRKSLQDAVFLYFIVETRTRNVSQAILSFNFEINIHIICQYQLITISCC